MSRNRGLGGKVMIVFIMMVCLPALASAQVVTDSTFTQTESPSPVASGARAMGTGGAFIAIADDATAANWNPAGTVQLLQPEFSVAGTGYQKDSDGRLAYSTEINYLSMVAPFAVGDTNVAVSLNYQLMYDFYFKGTRSSSRSVSTYTATIADPTGPPPVVFIDTFTTSYPYDTKTIKDGYLAAMSPSLAIQVTPTFAVGITYNRWSDSWLKNRYEQTYTENRGVGTRTQLSGAYNVTAAGGLGACTCNGGGPCTSWGDVIDDPACLGTTSVIDGSTASVSIATPAAKIESKERTKMTGENYTFGILWEPDPQWTVGAMYRSEFTLDLRRDVDYFGPTGNKHWRYNDRLRLPAAYGAGVSYRYSDEFLVAFDVTRTEYNRSRISLDDGRRLSPINGLPIRDADISALETYRLGSEYLIVQPKYVVALRSGAFYDPEPAKGHRDDYYGGSVGVGLVYEPVVIDIAYWYRWGNDVVRYTEYDTVNQEYTEVKGDVAEQMLMLSAVVHL